MGILTVLGMVDRRDLVFAETKARLSFDRDAVVFGGKDGEKTVPCAISTEALADHFGGRETDPLKQFSKNRDRIEHEARKKYVAGGLEPDGSVFIRIADI
jgi:hypothetical protein